MTNAPPAVVVLDSGPLGLIVHPGGPPVVNACRQWFNGLLQQGRRIVLPEIADYELRRELLRTGRMSSLRRLDGFAMTLEYLPLTTEAMRQAADFWALARQQGLPTADPHALDGDVILAAQAVSFDAAVVVATTNVGHLTRFVPADF